MTLVNLRNLGVTLGVRLFSGLNLAIAAGDRIGIVAANGRGKSTLIQCIMGTVEPTEGEVTRARGLAMGHMAQHMPGEWAGLGVREAAAAALRPDLRASEGWRADVALDALDIPESLRARPLGALSGGWQRLAMLARALVTEPDLLLLDEPTNHLDLARMIGLETWLAGLPASMAVVVASHDRAFLDAVTRRTLFLRPEASQLFALPYAKARAALDERDVADERRYQRDMKTAQQLRRQAAKLNNLGINSGSDLLTVKTRQLRQRAERLEEAARPAHMERSAGQIRLADRGSHAKALVTLDDARVEAPDGTLLFRTGRRFISQGDRIVLLGANGAGKSRFAAMLRKAITHPEPGSPITATPSLVLGFSSQDLGEIGADETPAGAIAARFAVGDQRARALLAGAGFAVEMQGRSVARLSGGQKARLAMLVLRLTEPNFHLLDEPTNHLDIDGQEALEHELTRQQATCLLISHDRSFVRAVGNRFWLIENRRLTEVEDAEAFFAAAGSAGR
ncbi:ABC-F family ATP-binding cassette domain-containing protein [Phreatobacter sp. AB_2022a]|uniref:ABC-F family ATP-binding cassette domain-containing protein n=1 Tax=Phreatobacter sp. AB_2022a TaxID=3003134 RepID=UPI0022872C20|nr:ABC-F family ATP-binding cassette domain-containing protein [Phreatobacter sp. AB_2022a]MCZ0738594.1 ABC-F family ATP-binding cassette domain-containing protein [Phreatobacter sp. AB_2022a]